jgi:hypothetical protein
LKSTVTGCSAAITTIQVGAQTSSLAEATTDGWAPIVTFGSRRDSKRKNAMKAIKPRGSPDIHDSFGHRLVRLLVKAESSSLRSPWPDPMAQDLATHLYR